MVDSSLPDIARGDGSSVEALETGFELHLAAEVVGDALEAVDFETLQAGASLEEAVDVEQLGAAIGRPVGHLLVQRAIGDAAGDGLAGRVAREAGSRAGARAVEIAVDRLEYSS